MVAFDNNIYPFVPRSQECSLYHPSNGRQVWIRIIPFCLTCLSILYLHARRCTNARISFFYLFFCILGLCSYCHTSLTFFLLFYFTQFTLWKMLWAWMVGVTSPRAGALKSYWKLSEFQWIVKLTHTILFVLSEIKCAGLGSPSGLLSNI